MKKFKNELALIELLLLVVGVSIAVVPAVSLGSLQSTALAKVINNVYPKNKSKIEIPDWAKDIVKVESESNKVITIKYPWKMPSDEIAPSVSLENVGLEVKKDRIIFKGTAKLLAMRLAIDEVLMQVESIKCKVESNTPAVGMLNKNKVCVLIDGNKNIQNLDLEQRLFAKGDQRIFSIATASINAKVYRDKLMEEYHQKFPEYGFGQHKGYGTKLHMEQLKKHGACEIHRQSFAPVREVM